MATIKLPKLHEKQALIYKSNYKYNVVCSGRRFGKTLTGKALLIRCAVRDKKPAFYIAPTYKMAVKMWHELKTDLKEVISYKSENDKFLILKTGGSIRVFSGDNAGDGILGNECYLAVVDECGVMQNFQQLNEQALMPTMATMGKGAQIFYLGTPRGNNYFKVLFERGKSTNPSFKDYKYFRFTSLDNPFVDPDFIKEQEKISSEKYFQQEYLAKFITDVGALFRNVTECAVMDYREPYPGSFVAGIDFGRSNDYTVIIIMDVYTNEVVDMKRFTKLEAPAQNRLIKKVIDKWQPYSVLAEVTGIGKIIVDYLLEEYDIPIIEFKTTNQSKQDIVTQLALDFGYKNISILADNEMIDELISYEETKTPTGKPKYGAPEGKHDDIVMALALANWQRSNFVGTFGTGVPMLSSWGNL